jgi:hypothetical protein
MPRVVVRKGYRCLPGKRRELLAALQRVDAAAAEAGWPRGRYLFVETKAPGEPDVEVEFTFDSYSEMEQLERRLREHLGRSPRDAASIGTAGQEFLLEPSSTRYLLLLDDGVAAAPPRRIAETQPERAALSVGTTTNPAPAPPPAPTQPAIQRRQAGPPPYGGGPPAAPSAGGADRFRPATPATRSTPTAAPAGPSGRPRQTEPLPPLPPEAPDEDELFDEPEPEPAEPPLSPAERRLRQLAEARAALDKAESTVNVSPEQRARARQVTQRRPAGEE